MKTRALKNYGASVGLEVYDIDLNSDEEILELGRLVAEQNIVFCDQKIDPKRLYDIQMRWGNPSVALLHRYILEGKLSGRHWREIFRLLGVFGKQWGKDMGLSATYVSMNKDEKGNAIGIFDKGELTWHSDQCAIDDGPRMIGLQSAAYSEGSQTAFLCTHDAYESLSSDMRSMVDELVCVHKWRNNVMAPDLDQMQTLVIHYNMVPMDGLETRLKTESAAGLPGMKFPAHSFDYFKGLSRAESQRVLIELHKAVYQDKYVYTHDWKDGQIVWMDQEITLHMRPTKVLPGSKRSMVRIISYLDKLYPNKGLVDFVKLNGKKVSHDEFAVMVDAERRKFFEEEQQGGYASTVEPFAY